MVKNVMLYWAYYKSTVVINLCVSAAIVLIASFLNDADVSLYLFAASLALIGPSFAFLYKEIVRPLEYYFYYNRAISKIKLIAFCLTVNILLATIISLIGFYVT